MQDIHHTTGPVSFCETPIKDRNIGDGSKVSPTVSIQRANSIDIVSVFNSYGLTIDKGTKKIRCPFPFHEDSDPSFQIYVATNSFNCWSCKHGGGCTDFVALMENITKFDAAKRLLNDFASNPNFAPINSDFKERHRLNLEFSTLIRSFIESNSSDPPAIEYADKLCLIFDTICVRHKLDVDGLKLLLHKLTTKARQYK